LTFGSPAEDWKASEERAADDFGARSGEGVGALAGEEDFGFENEGWGSGALCNRWLSGEAAGMVEGPACPKKT
jgi:hypothetical protein